ncbi:plasmid mobilization relaxosome protein MobC [Pseudomonas sp. DCB_CB]|uniref:plasmid mobilization relaxosome protein MobC n=1 Tax=unclassified Pseudomonas TaxID=196821 RepID=UPI002248EA6E|nr:MULTISPECIES: plasmid mobilization relaxosome protein MobC [unclassified Pseudomonas]MCX2694489.1 plasmid mobilization relaxosome protein MobC [Pseudomonas sp. DCB_BZ]MCX2859681.1 plasmid mobilization relaxosome protein MobC [Pseudomonas sp. DCB_CB]
MTTKSKTLIARVEDDVKNAFEARAKSSGLKPSELLRQLVLKELGLRVDETPLAVTEASAKVERVTVRIPSFILSRAAERGKLKGMPVSRWIGSLVQSNITKQPVMTENEINLLRAVTRELAAVGRNVNQIARHLNAALDYGGRVDLNAIDRLPTSISNTRKAIHMLIKTSKQSWAGNDE